jgi:hypothetical protein
MHPPDLLPALADLGRRVPGGEGEASVLYDRHGVLVVRVGEVVVKAHQADRDGGPLLTRRMELASTLHDLLLPPLGGPYDLNGRVVTLWPYATPVDPTQDLPWAEAGCLLARLHNTPIPPGAPPWGRPTRVERLVARLTANGHAPATDHGIDERSGEAIGRPSPGRYDGAIETIRKAYATLPAHVLTGEPPSAARARLLHGDWHLGQMVSEHGEWRLIDVEDLGVGDPAWDLARPAALFAAGVLPPDDWARFLAAYQEAEGPAVPSNGDPWQALDLPARTLAIQIAATCVISARAGDRPLDEPEEALIEACSRISQSREPGMT